ncbi:hypothetical protein GQ457_13G016060 [Hibiscus cannabinus]
MATARSPPSPRDRNYLFCFDSCWANKPDCIDLVHTLWAHTQGSLPEKLFAISYGLCDWQHSCREKDLGRISMFCSEINRLSSRHLGPRELEIFLAAKGEIRHLLNLQEVYWAQRSWVLWLSAGDHNTSFFHAKAMARRRKGSILGLYNAQGSWCTSTIDIHRIATDYFTKLFSTGLPLSVPSFLDHISPLVTDTMNDRLFAAFTSDEVVSAFRDINPRKSPGIDGLPSGFFRQYWDVLGDEFVSLCLALLNDQADMASVNATIIVLIPKVDRPTWLPPCHLTAWERLPLDTGCVDSGVRMFRDRWGGFSPICLADTSIDNDEVPLRCRDFMLPGLALWDHFMLSTILPSSDVDSILNVPISVDRPDTLIWGDHDSGVYFVRSGYLYLQRPATSPAPPSRLWKILIKLPTVPKLRSFGWRCGRDALLVGSRLRDAGLSSGLPPCHLTAWERLPLDTGCVDSGVRMFRDRWGGFSPICLADTSIDNDEVPLRCRDFMLLGLALWDHFMLSTILPSSDVDSILNVPISVDRPDTLIWGDHDSGVYFVRSGYLYLQRPATSPAPPSRLWKILIKLPTVPKLRSFGWRCGRDALLVGSRLRDAGLSSGLPPCHLTAWERLPLDTGCVDSGVRMFRDRWGGFSPICLADTSIDNDEVPLRCRDFMLLGLALWDHFMLSTILPSSDVDSILNVPISVDRPDTLIWGDHDSGVYFVRSGYLYLQRPATSPAPPSRLWKILIKLPTVPKLRSFGWCCGRDALLVGSRLRDAGLSSGACPLCGGGLETTFHALRDCPDSSVALRQAGFCGPLLTLPQASALDWLSFATTSLSRDSLALLLTLLWGL